MRSFRRCLSENVSWDKTLRGYDSIKVFDVVLCRVTTLISACPRLLHFFEHYFYTGLLTDQFSFIPESKSVNLSADTTFKYRVFKDLWERGGTITPGESFGGDFLVYPGDPMYFHASHIVHVIESGNISPVTMMSCGRLAVHVKKQCVFAVLDVEKNEICYLNMSWEGNKSPRVAENKGNDNS